MRITLLNDNSAVSRLINISVAKLGHELKEVHNTDDIDGRADLLICDNGSIENGVDYSRYASDILYLVPRNHHDIANQKYILIKPFLPTDFMNIIDNILNSKSSDQLDKKDDEDMASKASFHDTDDGFIKEELSDFDELDTTSSFGDIKNLDELYEKDEADDFFTDEADELEKKSDEITNYDDELTKLDIGDTNKSDETELKNSLDEKYDIKSQAKKEEFNELSHMLEEIDNMDIKEDLSDGISKSKNTDNILENMEINLDKNNIEISSLDEDLSLDENENIDSLNFIKKKEKENEIGVITDDLAEYALGSFGLLEEELEEEVVKPKEEEPKKIKSNDDNMMDITDDLAFDILGMDISDEENLNEKKKLLDESTTQDIKKELDGDGISELDFHDEGNLDNNISDESFDETNSLDLKNDLLEDNLVGENLGGKYISDELNFSAELESIENDVVEDTLDLDEKNEDRLSAHKEDELNLDIDEDALEEESKLTNIDENLTNEELEDLSFLEEIGDEKLTLEELKELQQQCVDENSIQEESKIIKNMSENKLDEDNSILDGEPKNLEHSKSDDSKFDFLSKDDLNLDKQKDIYGKKPKEDLNNKLEIFDESFELFDIGDIDENEIKKALNEEIVNSQTTLLKNELSKKISEEIRTSLNKGDLKEALKNMKINISISFEE